jgi:hypothetical protein
VLRATETLRKAKSSATVWAALACFVATIFQNPELPEYDAATYWAGATYLVHFANPYAIGGLALRGIWTSVMYVPAAALSLVIGSNPPGFSILVQNAVLVAVIGAVILPRIAAAWRPVTPRMTYACTAIVWLLIDRYAPLAISDLYGVALVLTVVAILTSNDGWRWYLFAGACAGIAMNIRPAYLVTIVVVTIAVAAWKRLRVVSFAAGTLLSLVPESILNLLNHNGISPFPPLTFALADGQSQTASFIVRYDTVGPAATATPRLFWCSPQMSHIVHGHLPANAFGLASVFLHHPVQASVFVSEKLAAVLHWPMSAPFYTANGFGDSLFAILITAVTVVGALTLWSQRRHASRCRSY